MFFPCGIPGLFLQAHGIHVTKYCELYPMLWWYVAKCLQRHIEYCQMVILTFLSHIMNSHFLKVTNCMISLYKKYVLIHDSSRKLHDSGRKLHDYYCHERFCTRLLYFFVDPTRTPLPALLHKYCAYLYVLIRFETILSTKNKLKSSIKVYFLVAVAN